MKNIIINGTAIPMTAAGFFNLDAVFKAIDTEEFRKCATMAGRAQYMPSEYLAKGPAVSITNAMIAAGKPAFVMDASPNGGAFVCRELLLDYARLKPSLFIDLISQFVDQEPAKEASNALSKDEDDFLDLFFDAFIDLNDNLDDGLNHSHDPNYMAINLSQAIKVLKQNGVEMPYRKDVVRMLKHDPSYDGNRSVKSKVWGHNAWCFLFKRS